MNDKEKVVEKLEGTNKNLWCPKCKCFPDKIHETTKIYQERKWNKEMDCYELEGEFKSEEILSNKCGECNTELMEE